MIDNPCWLFGFVLTYLFVTLVFVKDLNRYSLPLRRVAYPESNDGVCDAFCTFGGTV